LRAPNGCSNRVFHRPVKAAIEMEGQEFSERVLSSEKPRSRCRFPRNATAQFTNTAAHVRPISPADATSSTSMVHVRKQTRSNGAVRRSVGGIASTRCRPMGRVRSDRILTRRVDRMPTNVLRPQSHFCSATRAKGCRWFASLAMPDRRRVRLARCDCGGSSIASMQGDRAEGRGVVIYDSRKGGGID